jgi:wyosine [tRNA(Phe)-imidazoG37] synthetase (radical SAM superfamily)
LALKKAILQINPDRVQLNSLDRPGTEAGLKSMTREDLENVATFLNLGNVEIISRAPSRKDIRAYRTDAESAITETISRRPCTLDDLVSILGMHASEINKYLDVLEADGKISHSQSGDGIFYQIKNNPEK